MKRNTQYAVHTTMYGIFSRSYRVSALAILLAAAASFAGQEEARDLIIEGVKLGKQEKFDEALPLFEKALEEDPASLAAHVNVATAYFLWGREEEDGDRYVEAVKALERASMLAPHERQAGGWMRQNGGFVVQRLAEKAAAEGAGAADHYHLASAYMLADQIDEAVDEFRKAAELEPGSAAIMGDLGRALLRAGKTEEGRKALEKAVDLDPGLPGALINLGNLRFREGDLDGALALYLEARGRGENNSLAHAQLGRLYLKTGSLKEAKRELNAALKLNRHLVQSYLDLAELYLRERNYPAAIQQCEAVLREKQKYPEAEILLGDLYYLQKDLPGARKHFRTYLQTSRQHRTENEQLIEKCREHCTSRLEEIRSVLGAKKPKKRSERLFKRAHRYYEAGDYEEALNVINDLLEEEESMGKVFTLLGTILLKKEDPDPEMAMNIFRSALRDHIVLDEGSRILTYRGLAEACLRAGKPDQAEEALLQLLELRPDHIDSYYDLARIHAEKGEAEKSIEKLRRGAGLEREKGRKSSLEMVLHDPAFETIREKEEIRLLKEENLR